MPSREGKTMRRILILTIMCIALLVPLVEGAILDNLLFFHNFETLSGTPITGTNISITDSSVNSRNGWFNYLNTSIGKIGTTALSRDNYTAADGYSYITEDCPNAAGGGWCPDQDFTMSFWIKKGAVTATDTFYPKFGGDTSTTTATYGFVFRLNADDTLRLYYVVSNARKGNTSFINPKSCTWVDGNWHHIVGQRNGSRVQLYCDGAFSYYYDTGSTGAIDWQGTLNTGKEASGGTTSNVDWKWDEVGLWDRVLTAAEISTIYNSGNGLAYPFTGVTSTCTYSGTGNWIITENCRLTSSVRLQTGYLMIVKGAYDVTMNSGVEVN
jgi:hypothetical protein